MFKKMRVVTADLVMVIKNVLLLLALQEEVVGEANLGEELKPVAEFSRYIERIFCYI